MNKQSFTPPKLTSVKITFESGETILGKYWKGCYIDHSKIRQMIKENRWNLEKLNDYWSDYFLIMNKNKPEVIHKIYLEKMYGKFKIETTRISNPLSDIYNKYFESYLRDLKIVENVFKASSKILIQVKRVNTSDLDFVNEFSEEIQNETDGWLVTSESLEKIDAWYTFVNDKEIVINGKKYPLYTLRYNVKVVGVD